MVQVLLNKCIGKRGFVLCTVFLSIDLRPTHKLVLKLITGHGDQAIREKLFDIERNNALLFKGKLNSFPPSIYTGLCKRNTTENFLENNELDMIRKR
jgi:hypothetical protein